MGLLGMGILGNLGHRGQRRDGFGGGGFFGEQIQLQGPPMHVASVLPVAMHPRPNIARIKTTAMVASFWSARFMF